jgi:hypothetical protein
MKALRWSDQRIWHRVRLLIHRKDFQMPIKSKLMAMLLPFLDRLARQTTGARFRVCERILWNYFDSCNEINFAEGLPWISWKLPVSFQDILLKLPTIRQRFHSIQPTFLPAVGSPCSQLIRGSFSALWCPPTDEIIENDIDSGGRFECILTLPSKRFDCFWFGFRVPVFEFRGFSRLLTSFSDQLVSCSLRSWFLCHSIVSGQTVDSKRSYFRLFRSFFQFRLRLTWWKNDSIPHPCSWRNSQRFWAILFVI